jgi:hypothetical protein
VSAGEGRPVSDTHERAVLQQDNGELAEDVIAKGEPGDDTDDRVDEEAEESFPASDPPSSWSGHAPAGDPAGRARVVERNAVAHPPERDAPDDPVPKTLPRKDPGTVPRREE